MVQLCETRTGPLSARQLSAQEFCFLARQSVCGLYRPRSELARMLAVGEAWGVCGERSVPAAALLLLPLNSNAAAPAALREYLHWDAVRAGCLMLPPVPPGPDNGAAAAKLIAAAARRGARLARGGQLWAAAECGPDTEALAAAYIAQGFELRAVRPLSGLAPCCLFAAARGVRAGRCEWVPLCEMSRVARWLARGWAGAETQSTPQGLAIGLRPPA